MNSMYTIKAARFMQRRGATVIAGASAPDPIPMFDIVACPRPFKENEEEALDAVIKCLSNYYDQVLEAAGRQEGIVYIQPSTHEEWQEEHVAINVAVMAGKYYVGPEGGDIAELKEIE